MPEDAASIEVVAADGAAPTRQEPRYAVWLRSIATLAILGVIITGFVWMHGGAGAETSQAVTLTAKVSGPAPKVGKEAPDFRLRQLDGSLVQLSDFRGHPVWVTFWTTWCPPCRAESPDIEAAFNQYRDSGLIVLAVDVGENAGTVRDFAARTGLTFIIAGDETTEVASSYRSSGVPTHFFIDADGVLRDWQIGSLSKNAIDKKIAAILPAGVQPMTAQMAQSAQH